MDYGKLVTDLVAEAFKNQLEGLTIEVVFHYLLGQGTYNAAEGRYEDNTDDSDPITVVAARPTMDDVQNFGVVATNKKLLVPTKYLPRLPDTNTTVTIAGKLWTVRKIKEIPGNPLVLVFVEKN